MRLATLLTPPGRGAVATIRLQASGGCQPPDSSEALEASRAGEESGGLCLPLAFRAADGRPLGEQAIGRIVFGRWGEAPGEEVVVCRVSEDALEIHCHGGTAAVTRVLDDLRAEGANVVPWQEWLERTQGTFAAELADALARAPTERCARILLAQSEAKLRATDDRAMLVELLRWAEFGRHLAAPWQVVLTGRPNVGKSSLVNALLGYGRAIVSEQPGTTRDVVTAETAFDGWPVRLSDTAGIRETSGDLEQAGIARATATLRTADLRVVVLDASEPPTPDDHRILAEWPEALVVLNKCDLPAAWDWASQPDSVRVSCLSGEGLPALMKQIVARLVPVVPQEGTAIPFTARQVELIEAALRREAGAAGVGVQALA